MPFTHARPWGHTDEEPWIRDKDCRAASCTQQNPPRPPAFPKIPRHDLYETVAEREAIPSAIHQRGSSLCGPASLLHVMASNDSAAYGNFVRELYETGVSTIGTLKIRPGRDCRNFNPAGKIASADWVGLASIRDSENVIFDYDDTTDAFAGITLPGGLAGWFRKVGYGPTHNETNLYFTKDEDNFRDARRELQQGRSVCLFINADVLEAGITRRNPFSQTFTIPNHWIVLKSARPDRNGQIDIHVFTWGEIRHLQMPLNVWLQNYYGYVSCQA